MKLSKLFVALLYLILIVVAAILLWVSSAQASTRLGLHVTAEEKAVWIARMTDNVNTINSFTYQAIYQNRIKADADEFVAQSHPGADGHWEGYTDSGCVPADDQSVNPGAGGTPYGRGNGAFLMRSAFTFLLTGSNTYADPVRTELLQQITEAGTDWTNTSKWCYTGLGGGNVLEIVPWIIRVMFAYDYLVAGGYSGFSAGEHTSIKAWLQAAATLWKDAQINGTIVNTAYPGIYDTPPDLTCVGGMCTADYGSDTHLGGWDIRQATAYTFYNQAVPTAVLTMGMGLMMSDAALLDHATKLFTAYITAGVYDDGAVADYSRWEDCTPHCVGAMWGHTAGVTNGLIAIADMLARTGNTSLYDLLVATQVPEGNGGNVGLGLALTLYARLANDTVEYRTGDNNARLTWDVFRDEVTEDFYHDFGSMVGNLYYRNSEITTAMTRNALRANAQDGCFDPQLGGCWLGNIGQWADLPFMFGNMEQNAANPYLPGGVTARKMTVIVVD